VDWQKNKLGGKMDEYKEIVIKKYCNKEIITDEATYIKLPNITKKQFDEFVKYLNKKGIIVVVGNISKPKKNNSFIDWVKKLFNKPNC